MDDSNQLYINESLSIPRDELQFRFSTSRGPGGQHANRAASRVTLLFDISSSPTLDEKQRSLLLRNLAYRIDKRGVLSIDVQESRGQRKNRETAEERFRSMILAAMIEPKKRRKTRPGAGIKERRLASKKKRSALKKGRGSKWDGEG